MKVLEGSPTRTSSPIESPTWRWEPWTGCGRHPAVGFRPLPSGCPGRRRDRFALKLTAWLEAPADGEYTFFTRIPMMARASTSMAEEVVDNDGVHQRSGEEWIGCSRLREGTRSS